MQNQEPCAMCTSFAPFLHHVGARKNQNSTFFGPTRAHVQIAPHLHHFLRHPRWNLHHVMHHSKCCTLLCASMVQMRCNSRMFLHLDGAITWCTRSANCTCLCTNDVNMFVLVCFVKKWRQAMVPLMVSGDCFWVEPVRLWPLECKNWPGPV